MERIVVWLCLVVSPTQSCILEKRFFQRPVSVGILETSMSKTWEGVRAALHRAACRCATRAALGGAVALWRSRTWRALRVCFPAHRGPLLMGRNSSQRVVMLRRVSQKLESILD